MSEKIESDAGVYIDSSALAKLYVPEPESEQVERFLLGRRDLIISDLSVTEVISAAARRKREKALSRKQAIEIRDAVLSDAGSGSFRRAGMSPSIHRKAERMLLATESVPLRTLDALHIALALSVESKYILTFDSRMADAATLQGLQIVEV